MSGTRRRRPRPRREMTPAEKIDAALARTTGPQPTLTFEIPRRAAPSFTPASPAPTGAQPVLAEDPLDPSVPVPAAVAPLIGDSLPQAGPEPDPEPEPEPEPGADALPYTGPGWTRLLTTARLETGEWDDVAAIAERGLGENAAEAATAFRHSRKRIENGAWQLCEALGRPDLTGFLLRRVTELNAAANGGVRPAGPGQHRRAADHRSAA
jgi:hypothetical protein